VTDFLQSSVRRPSSPTPRSSLSTTQWGSTGYLLAMFVAIPIPSWIGRSPRDAELPVQGGGRVRQRVVLNWRTLTEPGLSRIPRSAGDFTYPVL